MSGHSKWHQIKHKKAVTDSHKSKLFGRLVRDITIAARAGTDPATNAPLREAVARAKKANLPQEKITNALTATDAADLQEIIYEGFGPGGVSVLLRTVTDNPNRTVQELRTFFKAHLGTLGSAGSVKWKFTPAFIDGSAAYTVRPELQIAVAPGDTAIVAEFLAAVADYPDVTHVWTDMSGVRS